MTTVDRVDLSHYPDWVAWSLEDQWSLQDQESLAN
jgi:hypothetical protein